MFTKEKKAQAQIYYIGQAFCTEVIRFIGAGTIDKPIINIQQQKQRFNFRVLEFRVEKQKIMTKKVQLAALEKH